MKSSEVNMWLQRVKMSQEERKILQPNWDELYRYFRGLQWDTDRETNKEVITVNLVYSHVKVAVPSVYFTNPYLYFEPNKPSAVDLAYLTEKVLNARMETMDLKTINRAVVTDAVLYGSGFTKTTYEVDDDTVELSSDEQNTFNNIDEEQRGKNDNLIIPANGSRVVHINPWDIGVAVGATDFYDPGYIFHHVRKRVGKLKEDKYYKNTSDLQPNTRASDEIIKKAGIGTFNDDYFDYVDLYEIWDIENQRFCLLAEGHDKELRNWEENPYNYDNPFDRLVFTPLRDQIYGMSMIEPWLPQQDEINENRTQSKQHVKRYNRKYAIRERDIVDETQLVHLTDGTDGAIILTKGDMPASNVIAPIADAPMPPDVVRHGLQAYDDQIKVSGLSGYRRGENAGGGDTATEAAIIDRASNIRDQDMMDSIASLVKKQMEKVRISMAQYTPGLQIIKLTDDPTAKKQWDNWTRKDIDINSEMRISYQNALPINQQKRQNDAVLLYDRAVANPTVNPQSAFTHLLKEFNQQSIPEWFLPAAIIQLQMMQKALGQQLKDAKGVSATAGQGGAEPGPVTPETSAELRGRAASA